MCPSQWRHHPGTLNPADTSPGLSVHQLLSNERWFSGPAFLSKPDVKEWPQADFGELSEDDLEVKNEKVIFTLKALCKLHELLVRYSSTAMEER